MDGGPGDDTLGGNEGNDIVQGGSGADKIDGGDGDDILIGSFVLGSASFKDYAADMTSFNIIEIVYPSIENRNQG